MNWIRPHLITNSCAVQIQPKTYAFFRCTHYPLFLKRLNEFFWSFLISAFSQENYTLSLNLWIPTKQIKKRQRNLWKWPRKKYINNLKKNKKVSSSWKREKYYKTFLKKITKYFNMGYYLKVELSSFFKTAPVGVVLFGKSHEKWNSSFFVLFECGLIVDKRNKLLK